MDLTDEQLVALFRQDEHKGFRAIFQAYYHSLCTLAYTYVRNTALAEDVVQDVLAGIWQNRKRIGVRSSLKGYLRASVRHACFDRLKAEQKDDVLLRDSAREAGWLRDSSRAERLQLPANLLLAVKSLPPGCKFIFNLVYFEGCSYKEAAAVAGVSVNTVKTQLNRAVRHIKKRCDSGDI